MADPMRIRAAVADSACAHVASWSRRRGASGNLIPGHFIRRRLPTTARPCCRRSSPAPWPNPFLSFKFLRADKIVVKWSDNRAIRAPTGGDRLSPPPSVQGGRVAAGFDNA